MAICSTVAPALLIVVLPACSAGGTQVARSSKASERPAAAPASRAARASAKPGDADGDGVPDADDFCPNEPEDADGCDDEDGCPDPDNDGDGIPDVSDRCPLKPQGPWGKAGCPGSPPPAPDGRPVVVVQAADDRCLVLEPIQFAWEKIALAPEANQIIDSVAVCLRDLPQVLVVELVGLSDARERTADLAERRAAAVRDRLVARGIDQRRLRVAPANLTSSADAQRGRRVEFLIRRTLSCPQIH